MEEMKNDFNKRANEFFDDLVINLHVFVLEPVADFFRSLRWYFSNLHRFRKDLWNYRTWDSEYCFNVFATSLEGLRDCLIDGREVKELRMKKVARIQELIDLLRNDPENDNSIYDKYIHHEIDFDDSMTEEEHELLSKELRAYEDAIKKAEERRLKRMYQIIKGQSDKELDTTKDIEALKIEDPERAEREAVDGYYSLYADKFDGTGYKSWWD